MCGHVRACSNPLAGTDCTLLALAGAGYADGRSFGFASCERRAGAAEGVNLLMERRLKRHAALLSWLKWPLLYIGFALCCPSEPCGFSWSAAERGMLLAFCLKWLRLMVRLRWAAHLSTEASE
jgi:hypothetical protein